MGIKRWLRPAGPLGPRAGLVLSCAWGAAALGVWAWAPTSTLPSPAEVARALGELWWERGLGEELLRTLLLIGEATATTIVLSLGLAYASVLPAFRPLVAGLAKLRFLSLTGLVVPLTVLTGGGGHLKIAMLTFGMATFYLTAMARIVAEIPAAEIDHMKVLGASDARIVWEVVVRGTLDRALDALRQNVAMGWSMITMVEGIARSDGGIGALILDQQKHFRLAHVYAVLAVVLAVGLLIDRAMAGAARLLCPHLDPGPESASEESS
jgi:NitT/TauT family transport system permease protein